MASAKFQRCRVQGGFVCKGRHNGWESDSDSDTRDPQDVQHAQQAQYDHHSEPYEQDDSQASMYRRGPRREPYIIQFYCYFDNIIDLQEIAHFGENF